MATRWSPKDIRQNTSEISTPENTKITREGIRITQEGKKSTVSPN